MRKILHTLCAIVLTAWLTAGPAIASDITKGYAFTEGEKGVTHTKLNNLVDAATINTSFYTDKTTAAPGPNDLLLLYSNSGGGFRKMTLDSIFYSNIGLITNLTVDATPNSADYFMTYDVSAGALRRGTLLSAFFENDALINARTNWTTPTATDTYFLSYNAGAWAKVTRANLFYSYAYSATFTNLPTLGTPANADMFMVWKASAGSNTMVQFDGLITNLPAASAATSGDVLLGYSTNSTSVVKTTLAQVRDYVAANPGSLATTNYVVGAGMLAAWAKFNGTTTGTHAVTAGNNVSNIVRTAAGTYTVNFTNAMASTNYCIQVTVSGTGTFGNANGESEWGVLAQTATSFTVQVGRGSFSAEDRLWLYLTVFQ